MQSAGDDSLLRAAQAQNEARKAMIEGVAPTADNQATLPPTSRASLAQTWCPPRPCTGKQADKLYAALDAAAEEHGAAMTLPFDALNSTAKRLVGRGVVDKGQVPAILGEAGHQGSYPRHQGHHRGHQGHRPSYVLAQALRKNGGIRNTNLDGTAHDLQGEIDHVRTFTKNIVNNQKGSKTIDDMADLMHQQGWLPDNDPNTLLNHLRDPDLANATKRAVEDPDAAFKAMFERGTTETPSRLAPPPTRSPTRPCR